MPEPPSLPPDVDAFAESLQVRRYSESTIRHRRKSLVVFFKYLAEIQVADVREVARQTVRDYQAWLLERYAVTSAHLHLTTLRRFFEYLENRDLVLINPCLGLRLPKMGKRLPKTVLTPGEARRVLDAPDTQTLRGIRDKAILEVFYSTGIRLDELTRLTVLDVDYKEGFVRVKGKGCKDRVAPMGSKACDYVREYLQKVRAQWSKANRDERALWLSSRKPHGPIKAPVIEVLVRHYGQQAGVEKRVTPHVWRHSCATHLLANGSDVASVQRLLGHRWIKTTQVYTRVSIADVKATHQKAHPREFRRVRGLRKPATP